MKDKRFAVIYAPHRRNKPAPEVVFAEGWDDEARARATFEECKKSFPNQQVALCGWKAFAASGG
jgi:hypothetical protein